MLPGDHERVARLTEFYIAELRSGPLASGVVDVARTRAGGPIVGVAAWEGPHPSGTRWRELRELPRYLRAIGLRHLEKTLDEVWRYQQLRPRIPHWYLSDIGVSGSARGLGVGSALPHYRLTAVDAQVLPATWKSTSPANRAVYERFSFAAVGAVETTGSTAPVGMLRPAGARVG